MTSCIVATTEAAAISLRALVGFGAADTRAVNDLSLSASAFPIAWADGLTVAAQFVERPFFEHQILSAGMAVETTLAFGRRLPKPRGKT